MSGKRFRALIVAVLLALSLTISATAPTGIQPVLAAECDSTSGGGG